jgi:fucose permease
VNAIQGLFSGWLNSTGNCLLLYVHGNNVATWMHALHFSFGFGALIAPLLVRLSMAQSISGQSYTGAYVAFSALCLICAIILSLLQTPPPQKKENRKADFECKWGTSFKTLLLSTCFICIYVGGEIGFGIWIPVYSKFNLNFTEA